MIGSVWRRLKGATYRPIYWYRENYERFEAWVIVFELSLIGVGLWAVLTEIRDETMEHVFRLKFAAEHFKDILEVAIFAVLLMSGVSRLVVAARRSNLGYTYKKIADVIDSYGGTDAADVLYEKVEKVSWTCGSAPGLGGKPGSLLPHVKAIAARTATLLSVRSFHFLDERWKKREQDSLGEWFEACPAALWRVDLDEGAQRIGGAAERFSYPGYYSVIVPMTRKSKRSIQLGQKATDLAEIDRDASDVIAGRFNGADRPERLELLAYLQVHLPRNPTETTAPELLFAASMQHLAYLLARFYGTGSDFRTRWNFSILCEAANRRHSQVLEKLGFTELRLKAHERSHEPISPGRSYAGFSLFELEVMNGHPGGDVDHIEGRRVSAQNFIYFLEARVIEVPQQLLA
jgi:hypothetical protein